LAYHQRVFLPAPWFLALALVAGLLVLLPARRLQLAGMSARTIGTYALFVWLLGLAVIARPGVTRFLIPILLIAYIALIGPINYLVLRRIDRREWAWFTMPSLIVVFAVGAYGFGAALRGSEVVVNEIATVRGAAGATTGSAQVYLGVFSPSRQAYQRGREALESGRLGEAKVEFERELTRTHQAEQESLERGTLTVADLELDCLRHRVTRGGNWEAIGIEAPWRDVLSRITGGPAEAHGVQQRIGVFQQEGEAGGHVAVQDHALGNTYKIHRTKLIVLLIQALEMLENITGGHKRATAGGDKAYDEASFVKALREMNITPHVHQYEGRASNIDGRTTRHPGYRLSQIVRKRIEEHFGWGKTIGRIRQTVFRGLRRVDQQFKLTMTASNLMRLARMPGVVPAGVLQ
jgi:hypothetical protein